MTRRSEPPAPHGAPAALRGRRVLIVGPRRFQNLLLADFLSARAGVVCSLLHTGEPAPDVLLPAGSERLVLADCQECGVARATPPPGRVAEGTRVLHAIFNVPENWGGETRALRCGVKGFFYEDDPPESLVKGIARIFAGEVWVSRPTSLPARGHSLRS